MKICDLSNEDITRIVTDILSPKKITKIARHKRDDYVSCCVYTKWTSKDENGKEDTVTCKDDVEIRDPFKYGHQALWAGDIPLYSGDYDKLKQFCFAKGMMPGWMENNPYVSSR